ncbi:MAG TPA: MMPL family transporter [Thermoclostridium caenicola]|nr:MMPL family transporter [Thermoclostridium caenicola]
MDRLADVIVKKRRLIFWIFVLLTVLSACFIPEVDINYNLAKYLPSEMRTSKALEIMEKEFSLTGSARVMVEDISLPEAVAIKQRLAGVDGVKSVIWLDDVADIHKPLEYLDSKTVESYYKDGAALFMVEFDEGDYSLNTGKAVSDIQAIIGEKGAVGGSAVTTKFMRESTIREVVSAAIIAAPIIFIILLLTSHSWFEPFIYVVVMGVSVVINMGTNVVFGSISFITQASAALLQFAISMDYAIFLLHRYREEKARGVEPETAMKKAIISSFSSIGASCLTTVAGFVALMFMRYKIGFDMGAVLSKGVLISLLTVIFLLPGITLFTDGLLERTQHKPLLPSLSKLGSGIVRYGAVAIVLLAIIIVPAYRAQASNAFLYGENAMISVEDSEFGKKVERIDERFGIYNPLVLLVPRGSIPDEISLADALMEKDYVSSVQTIVTLADPAIPREILPEALLENFTSPNYTRMIINLDLPVESAATLRAVEEIGRMSYGHYGDAYFFLGSSSSVSDVKQVVDRDYSTVSLISICAVGLIILLTFRSLTIPVLLVLVIETSIWMNMAVPYFMDENLSFIGYLVVSAIQLGATVDYAILMTSRYMENRKAYSKKEAAIKALTDSGWSVITSAMILFVACMGVGVASSIRAVSEMILLLGRGAAISCVLVLVLLPQLLIIFDGVIGKTTLKAKERDKSVKEGTSL